MIIFNSLEQINNIEPSVCALGNFDGVHKGHQELINCAVSTAKAKGLKSAVFTFTEHPINVMSGHSLIKTIFNYEDKINAMESMGIDYYFTLDFTDEIRTMAPKTFAKELLSEKLNIKHAVCGFNYSFGYKAGGKQDDLISYGKEYGFDASVINPIQIDGVTVSSTLIRGCIEKGDLESYKLYTGRYYSIGGVVIEGEKNGRKMGFPTVNLSLDLSMSLPANGVYTTITEIDGKLLPSITNVGNKPTIGQFAKNAETHIFNFNKDIYGKELKIFFIKMQRAEKKFDGLKSLAHQIDLDCLEAQKYHNLHSAHI